VFERLSDRTKDVAVAVAVGGFAVANALHDDARHPLVVVAVAVAGAALFFRRTRTLQMFAVVCVAHVITLAAGNADVIPVSVVAFYSAALELPRRTAVRAGAAGAAAILAVVLVDGSDHPSSSPGVVVFLAGAFLLGDNARVRRERQQEIARQALADERDRIARELHDVITHNVSVMVVQAAAANDVFDERPDQAREALANVEETGRRALAELRTLLHVVGGGETSQPGLTELGSLVEQVRKAGLGVEFTVEGTPRELPAAVDLSAYRIVQESLTNTLKHARASHARILVRYALDELLVVVTDDGVGAAGSGGGRGLSGMRERISLLGGEVSAGSRPGGGFEIRARLPVEAA
jgi:signal transduction histidine kinase